MKQYSLVSKDLGIIHQRCVFHMMKDSRDEIKRYLKKTKDDLVTKMAVLRYLTEINNIFRTFDENECFNRYEAILNKSERLPGTVQNSTGGVYFIVYDVSHCPSYSV